jgi:hypothetical protein
MEACDDPYLRAMLEGPRYFLNNVSIVGRLITLRWYGPARAGRQATDPPVV